MDDFTLDEFFYKFGDRAEEENRSVIVNRFIP